MCKDRRWGRVLRVVPSVAACLTLSLVAPSMAGATIRVQNALDPAGDPTPIAYALSGGTITPPITFSLVDKEFKSFGPGPGTYTVQAAPPAGWVVGDIQCVGASPAVFQIDIPNGRVVVNHAVGAEDTCSFTNRRAAAPATGPATGVAPTPAPSDLPKISLPKKAALLRVTGGRRFASATVRVTRRSVIKAQLLTRGNRVAGSARVVKAAGTHVVRVNLTRRMRRVLARGGQQRASLTLRVVVVPVGGGPVQVFRFGVRVRLR